jgi:hypothetical protein
LPSSSGVDDGDADRCRLADAAIQQSINDRGGSGDKGGKRRQKWRQGGDRGSGRRQRGSGRRQRTEEEADTEAATEAAAATAVTEAAAEAAAATKAAEATAEATRWQRSGVVAEGGSGRGAVWWQRGQSSKVVTG